MTDYTCEHPKFQSGNLIHNGIVFETIGEERSALKSRTHAMTKATSRNLFPLLPCKGAARRCHFQATGPHQMPDLLVSCTGWFCDNVKQAGVIRDEGISAEEIPP